MFKGIWPWPVEATVINEEDNWFQKSVKTDQVISVGLLDRLLADESQRSQKCMLLDVARLDKTQKII